MFKVTRVNENRLDIVMSGKLNSEQMKNALDELVSNPHARDGHNER